MKTMNFFKAAMMTVVAMVMTVNSANADVINENAMMETAGVEEVEEALHVNASTNEKVNAHATDSYSHKFYAGELVYIFVDGDGDTDLDLYVYDENGHLIDSDTDEGDTCLCTFTPRWTGRFTIKVKNLGDVYNRYYIRFLQ